MTDSIFVDTNVLAYALDAVASTQAGGCRYLLTQDLQRERDFDGLRVINPFRTPARNIV